MLFSIYTVLYTRTFSDVYIYTNGLMHPRTYSRCMFVNARVVGFDWVSTVPRSKKVILESSRWLR
jgi:hypothetical protein